MRIRLYVALMVLLAATVSGVSCAPRRGTPAANPPLHSATSYAPFPNPDTRHLTDLAGVLSHAQRDEIDTLLGDTERETGIQIMIVTVKSISDYPGTPNDSIEYFARGVFNAYQIGKLPANKGLLFLVAMKEGKARIQLGAEYGFAQDNDAKRIMDDVILKRLRKGDMAGGIVEGAKALVRDFAGPQTKP
jgi:uncharacterized protein